MPMSWRMDPRRRVENACDREHALGRDVRLDVGDVERALGLALIGVVVDDRAFADDDFGDRVVEIRVAGGADERLRDPRLAVGAGHDQHARMRHRPACRRRR